MPRITDHHRAIAAPLKRRQPGIRGLMSRRIRKPGASKDDAAKTQSHSKRAADEHPDAIAPNPPRTTVGGWFTAPKFGSAGSGGAELEPGPERD
jgi:hypothetical protein